MARQTVLLASGDAETRAVFRAILEPTGYQVREASDAGEMWRAVGVERPDLLIAGTECLQPGGSPRLHPHQDDPRTTSVPVLLITSDGVSADAEARLGATCAGVFQKPIWPLLVQDIVHRVIGPARAA